MKVLEELSILDSEPDAEFDRVIWLAQRFFQTRFAVFSLVDNERQWFKASCGLDAKETPREHAFCAHTIMGDGILVVLDATRDARFAGNPLVTGAPHIRFYAGAPILVNGVPIGTLCVIDDKARESFGEEQRIALAAYAKIVEDELHRRHCMRRTTEVFDETFHYAREVARLGENAKAQFLALMSHELRTPLNAVIGFADCIAGEMMGPLGSEQYKEFARQIAISGKRQLNLIDRLLTLTGQGSIDAEDDVFDMAETVRQCAGILSGEGLVAGVTIGMQLPAETVSLKADPLHVEQIVLELIGNAIKFTPKGGHVLVGLRVEEDRSAILSVSDTGTGIDETALDETLTLFGRLSLGQEYTTEGARLGLPLVKKLADLHGAALSLSVQPNGGTLAEIQFPPYRTVAS